MWRSIFVAVAPPMGTGWAKSSAQRAACSCIFLRALLMAFRRFSQKAKSSTNLVIIMPRKRKALCSGMTGRSNQWLFARREAVNAFAVKTMAETCAEKGISLIHISTGYVFEGTGLEAFAPSDQTSPRNAYGRTKLSGENFVIDSGCVFAIFGTSRVFLRMATTS